MFMMFCGIQGTRNGHWQANRRSFDEAFSHFCQGGMAVVDGTRVGINGNQPVERSSCAVFFAKNRATLAHCLRLIPPGVTITATEGQLAFVSHSYDWEKIGGWARSKIKGAKDWNEFRQTDAGESYIGRGGTKEQYIKAKDRCRLLERGYYVGIANATDLRDHRDSQGVHGDRASLASFANLVTGQVTRQEAVNGLLEDLLIN